MKRSPLISPTRKEEPPKPTTLPPPPTIIAQLTTNTADTTLDNEDHLKKEVDVDDENRLYKQSSSINSLASIPKQSDISSAIFQDPIFTKDTINSDDGPLKVDVNMELLFSEQLKKEDE